jgi:hypothetical protein
MARTVSLLLSAQHSADLQGVIEDRGRPVKHVQRAQIILLSAERLPVLEIAKRVGVSRPMVWRWQQRFAEEGIEGLLRDKTRPPGIPPVPQAKVHAVVERTLREPPGAVALVRTALTQHNLPASCSNDRADECSTWTNSSKAAISIAK